MTKRNRVKVDKFGHKYYNFNKSQKKELDIKYNVEKQLFNIMEAIVIGDNTKVESMYNEIKTFKENFKGN
jgi:hypothetical protein